jgi:hypothetical protein
LVVVDLITYGGGVIVAVVTIAMAFVGIAIIKAIAIVVIIEQVTL